MSTLAAIHVARKQLGLDDDVARDLYQRVTGKRSLRDCSTDEHQRIVEELRRQGFSKTAKGSRKRLEGRFAAKLQALWIAAFNLGIARNRDDAALIAFVKRQTGIDHVRFVRDAGDASKAIEALKAWMAREAGVNWHAISSTQPEWMDVYGYRIASAQWRKLFRGAPPHGVRSEAERVSGMPIASMSGQDWQIVMNVLGKRLREERL